MKSTHRRHHIALHIHTLIALGLLLTAGHLLAVPSLPGFFTDNMVLQRDTEVPLWGWADPGEKIIASFAGQSVTATAGADGTWSLKLAPISASSEGQTLTISSAEAGPDAAQKLANIVVGDVWLCSGQSNMEWNLNAVQNSQMEAAAADYPLIRHMKVQHLAGDSTTNDLKSRWEICSPVTARGFTAVGYFFARHLHRELGVPVGLIGSNWGGTKIEPWTPPEGFRLVPELAALSAMVDATLVSTPQGRAAHLKALAGVSAWLPVAEAAVKQGIAPPPQPALPTTGASHQSPTRIYNRMIHPLIPYAIRGAIWYQGESNGGEGISYYHKKQAMIGGWRQLWKQGDFPFYFVQLANFGMPTDDPAGGDGYARIRDAQKAALAIPNTGMAVIIDIGEARNIHPRNKQDVGLRLALWALANEYGRSDLVYSGPLYRSHMVEGGAIRITFDHIGSGLMVGKKTGLEPAVEDAAGKLNRFAVAGADRKWHWAEAVIEGDSVLVSSPAVPEPVAVRYAFSHNPAGCNLYNREGLPASPFRTDNW